MQRLTLIHQLIACRRLSISETIVQPMAYPRDLATGQGCVFCCHPPQGHGPLSLRPPSISGEDCLSVWLGEAGGYPAMYRMIRARNEAFRLAIRLAVAGTVSLLLLSPTVDGKDSLSDAKIRNGRLQRDAINHSERYRSAQAQFLSELRESLACVPTEVFESSLGAALLAAALIEEAGRLVRGQLSEQEARIMLEELVHAQFRASATNP